MNTLAPERQHAIIESLRAGESLRKTAAKFSVSKTTVISYRKMLDLEGREYKETTPETLVEVETPTLCGCGCGEQVNPIYDQVRVLREERHTFLVIGATLGIDYKYAQMIHRKPPRFLRGHAAKLAVWRTAICKGCGREFRTSSKYAVNFCNSNYCESKNLRGARYKEFIRRLDKREDEISKTYLRNVTAEQRAWAAQDKARQREAEKRRAAEAKINIAAARKEYKAARKLGQPLPWALPDPDSSLTDEQQQELDQLIARQQREMKTVKTPGEFVKGNPYSVISLDQKTKPNDDGVEGPLQEFVNFESLTAVPSQDAYHEMQKEAVSDLLGDLTEQDVAHLDDQGIQRLQEKLREAGFGPGGVQAKERERLRVPERHRGSGTAPIGKHGTRKHHVHSSKEASELMKGKRPSRKPRQDHRPRRQAKDGWV